MTVAQVTCRQCQSPTEQSDCFCRSCGAQLVAFRQLASRHSRPVFASISNPLVKAEAVLVCALSFFVVSSAVWVGNSLKVGKLSKRDMVASRQAINHGGALGETEIDRLIKQAKTIPALSANSPVAERPVASIEHTAVAAISPARLATPFVQPEVKTPAPEVTTPTPSFTIEEAVAKEPVAENPIGNEATAQDDVAKVPLWLDEKSGESEVAKPEPKLTFKFEAVPDAGAQVKTVKKPKLTKTAPAKIDDLAQYNRQLAGYFAKKNAATASGAGSSTLVSEPASYDEWLAAGKPDL